MKKKTINAIKNNKLKAAGVAVSAYHGYSTREKALDKGDSELEAGIKGVATGLASSYVGPWKVAAGLALYHAPKKTANAYRSVASDLEKTSKASNSAPFGYVSPFVDTKQSYTMRQSAMAMINQSRAQLAHTFEGQEAQHIHR